MKNQRIYSYLQRSLIKVFIKSNRLSKETILLTKSLNSSSVSLTSDRNLYQLSPLLSRISEHSKQPKLFRKMCIKEKLWFKCQFFLITFKKSSIGMVFYSTHLLTLFNFFDHFKGKLVKLTPSSKTSEVVNNFADLEKQSLLLFFQSFYKKKYIYINFLKSFHKLCHFFSVFSLHINPKINFLNYAELSTEGNLVLQVLYKYNITCLNSSSPSFHFRNSSKSDIDILFLLGIKNSILKEKESSFFQLFIFLLIIFYVLINYIKNKKKFYKKRGLNIFCFQFNKIIEILFFLFKPFFRKIFVVSKTSNPNLIFLMRPLFSVTRFETFFICESLKLPVYPDKSNLRVDFLRNRVRKQILPTIRILLNPQFDTLLCKLSQ